MRLLALASGVLIGLEALGALVLTSGRSANGRLGLGDGSPARESHPIVRRTEPATWPAPDGIGRDAEGGSKDRSPGVRRLLFLGDSAPGAGDPSLRSYPHALSDILDERGPGVEVLSAESPWTAGPGHAGYERTVRAYSPDVILFGLWLDRLQERPPPAGMTGWLSALSPPDPRGASARDLVFSELRNLRSEVERGGGRLAVVLLPTSDRERRELVLQRAIEGFCAREDIPLVDTVPRLAELGTSVFRPGGSLQLSAAGSLRVASAIAASGLLPATWASSSALAREIGGGEAFHPRTEHIRPLARLLGSQDATVRRQAAWALGRIGPEARDTWPSLAARLRDPDETVRREAARALGRLRAAEARPALFRSVADRKETARRAIADVLAGLGIEAMDALTLVDLLGDPDPYVRAFAAWGLGECGKPAGWTAASLTRRLGDVDPAVRSVAAAAIERVGGAERVAE